MTHTLALLAAFILAVLATARATRLITQDKFPPILAARMAFVTWCGRHPRRQSWALIAECPFCAAPYVAAVVITVAVSAGIWSPDLGTVAGWWWILAVWASVAYLAAIVVHRDED